MVLYASKKKKKKEKLLTTKISTYQNYPTELSAVMGTE